METVLLGNRLGCKGSEGVDVGGSQEDSDYSVNTACQYLLLPGARASPSHLLSLQVPQTSLVRRIKAKCKDPTKTLSFPRPQFPPFAKRHGWNHQQPFFRHLL